MPQFVQRIAASLKDLWCRCTVPVDVRAAVAATRCRLEQHRRGWHVFLGDRKICTLEFQHGEPPFYEFAVIDQECSASDLSYVFQSLRRDADPKIRWVHRTLAFRLDDRWLPGGLQEDGTVTIRDMRRGLMQGGSEDCDRVQLEQEK